jgi:hypothetical protein
MKLNSLYILVNFYNYIIIKKYHFLTQKLTKRSHDSYRKSII